MIRLLLVDDHAMVRAGLRQMLERQPDLHVIADTADGATAVRLALQLVPTVAIVDIGLPDMDGLEVLEQIKTQAPQIRVLLLTGRHSEQYVLRALRGGASGYLLKESGPAELVSAVRRVARGELAFASVAEEALVRLYAGHAAPQLPGHSVLTERERAVLRLVAQGYSNAAAAARLGISAKTVDTHRTRLMEKLDLHNRAALTTYALRQGYLVSA